MPCSHLLLRQSRHTHPGRSKRAMDFTFPSILGLQVPPADALDATDAKAQATGRIDNALDQNW